ncbi:carbamoyl-phosphate synthase L chain, ATP binding domain-containing protein [Scleroderma yunnanense]
MIPTNRTAAQSFCRIPVQVGSLAFTNAHAHRTSCVRVATSGAASGIGQTSLRNAGSVRQGIRFVRRELAAVHNLSRSSRKPHFDKILIANRGEIACRIIRTAKKLGIKTVAVYSEVDANSLHVLEADEAYCIGPAPSSESYLRIDKIIDVCHKTGVQAVHPGYGFLSENAKFAEHLVQEGIVFIGPPPSAIISMGSKSESKNIMLAAGVPCVPGYHGTDQDPKHLFSEAEKIEYPVLIKAIHGGGGKGMRVITKPSEFMDGLEAAKRESLKAFGDDGVLVEKFIERTRHIEVQVFADVMGSVVSLWERDCSVQRRNQKIIEEAPAPGLSPKLRADLSDKAVAAAMAVHYVGAGTVEFIFDNDTEKFYFMEMNTRLQVEHPVTEMITGLDLVEWQLEVAAGNPLPLSQSAIPLVGHAFEARIYAENPRNAFLPDSGSLLYLSTPKPTHTFAPSLAPLSPAAAQPTRCEPDTSSDICPSLRLEQGFTQGAQIGVFYDPMIAKLVAHGRDRNEALRVLRRGLEEYKVVGVSTNVEFLRTLAGNEAFVQGDVETGFIKKHHADLFPPMAEPSPEVLARAALYVTLRDASTSGGHLSPWASLGARRFNGDVYTRTVTLAKDEPSAMPISVRVRPTTPGHFDIAVLSSSGPSTTFTSVSAQLASPNTLIAFSQRTTVVSQPPPALPASTSECLHIFSANGSKDTLTLPAPSWVLSLGGDVLAASKGALRAPMPSLIVEVKVDVGQRVEKGQAVVILESMKTETVLRSEVTGVVKAVGCAKGEMVEESKELVDIEADVDPPQ